MSETKKKTLGRRMTGAEAALPIWRQVIEGGLREQWISGDERFTVPAGVEFRVIEPESGLVAVPGTPRTFEESFLVGTAPTRRWEPRWSTVLSLPWPQQLAFYTPRDGEKMPDALAVSIAEQVAAAEEAENAEN